MEILLQSFREEETRSIGRALGEVLAPGDVVALTGDLGAGKTVFCKGVGEALGIPPDRITSPSFTMVTGHAGRISLTHVDAYRLSSEREGLDIGLDEVLSGRDGVCVVEWAENVRILLPNDCIRITFLFSDREGRRLSVRVPQGLRFERFRDRVRSHIIGG